MAVVDTVEGVVEGAIGEEIGFKYMTLVYGWRGGEGGYYGGYFCH